MADVLGRRGLLTIGPSCWPTVERWDVDTRLTPDRYTCEFGWWTAKNGARSKAIRILLTAVQFERIYSAERRAELAFLGARARGRIYVHPANYPHQLEGCIAPGTGEMEGGVSDSRHALQQIFEALGGWREGEKLDLEVVS